MTGSAPASEAKPPRRRPLARRYALLLGLVATTLLLLSGASEMRFQYQEAHDRIATLQRLQAQDSAREIATWLHDVERRVQDVAKMPWGSPGYGASQEREEFYRLMLLTPAIVSMQAAGADARERLFVSREDTDRVDSLRPLEEPALVQVSAREPVRRGTTFFRQGYLPSLRIAIFGGTQVVLATVDLRLLGEVVSRLRVGEHGIAYVVDAQGLLIAHPRATEMLRQVDLSRDGAVSRARGATRAGGGPTDAIETVDLAGRPVIATGADITGTGWIVVVEQPRSEALEPALATLGRTLLLIGVGLLAAIAVSVLFARRMAAPIVALRDATRRIAHGDLDTPLAVRSGDEIEDLAEDFNLMASRVRESYASLEARVRDRTLALSEARDALEARAGEIARLNERLLVQVGALDARSQEAERANQAKTRFLATASHDLRQPMHSISLLVGVLRDRTSDAAHLALVDKIQAATSMMEALFISLLDISKLDSGTLQPRTEDVDLGILLGRLRETWLPQAAERGLRLRVRPTRAVARSDAALLERMMGNLISNALRYTARGGVLVACRASKGGHELQVWDTGPGILPEHQELIFEEFVRIDAPGSRREKGLGLGLAIVQRGAQVLGHGVRVRSEPGRGSMFAVSVPAAPHGAAARALVASVPIDASALAGSFVAVVENDEDNREALVRALELWHCHVIAAASCREVLERSAEHLRSPDLVITDHDLDADADGFAVVETLRRRQDEPLPALMLTADTGVDVRRRAAEADVVLLHKPSSLGTLLEAILRIRASAA
jgi:signal transduction histidine kinase